MPPPTTNDTICAQATPAGVGAIAIVRLSGPQALQVVDKCFIPHSRQQTLLGAQSHTMVFGHLVDPEERTAVDDVLVSVMRNPHSYTGEDVVEINLHGSPALVRRTLGLLISLGARLAEPGEFTRRAFENGQIDLAQAEAVCDIISAHTRRAAEMALRQLQGALSERMSAVRQRLLDLVAEIEAHLDFPEEDLPTPQTDRWNLTIQGILEEVNRLHAEGERGRLLREGARVVLVGKPNAGKSSLFNRLLGQDRAIVTSEPGTTRDSIESLIEVAGLPLTVVDTAGLREAATEIEHMGISRTSHEIRQAAHVVVCIPAEQPWGAEDDRVWKIVAQAQPLAVLTKCDLPHRLKAGDLQRHTGSDQVLCTSAVTGEGIDDLIAALGQRLLNGGTGGSEGEETADPIVSSQRHIEALRAAGEALQGAQRAASNPPTLELVASDLRTALHQIDSILGLEVGDEVLDRIFARFCIGK